MRKTLLIGIPLLLLAAIAGGLLYFRFGSPQQLTNREGLARLRLGQAEPGQVLEPGVPILLRLDLSSPLAERLRTLSSEGPQSETKPVLPELPMGNAQQPWWESLRVMMQHNDVEQEIHFEVLRSRNAEFRLDRGEAGYALLGIDPVSPWKPGKYRLEGRIDISQANIGTIRSDPVTLTVQAGAMEEARKLATRSRYLRQTGHPSEAQQEAEKLIHADPESMEGYILKAEALEQQERYREARETYSAAMERFPEDSPERPELYLDALQRLDAQIRRNHAGE